MSGKVSQLASYDTYYAPGVFELVVVGDLKEQEALEKLAFMNKWESKDVRMPELPAALGYEVVDVSEKGDILEPVKEDVCGTEEGSN